MRFYQVMRRVGWTGSAILLAALATASSAHAHGGMAGPDDLGPPLATSAALAFGCYWLVILWPSKRKNSGDAPRNRQTPRQRNRHSRAAIKKTTSRRAGQLKIAAILNSSSDEGRAATDA